MPRPSVWLLRAALLHLLAGFTYGALMLAHKGIALGPWVWRLLPAHYEHLLLGWTLQLIMGVSFWILPRFRSSRGDVRLVWTACGLLNAGVLLVALNALIAGPALLTLCGRAGEVIAVLAYVANAWPRVKPAGA